MSSGNGKEIIRSPNYDLPQILEAMAAMAQFGGNTRKASKFVGIPRKTIEGWAKKWPHKYDELSAQVVAVTERLIARQAREIAVEAGEVELLALQQIREQLEAGNDKMPAATLQRLSTSKGINTDKDRLIRDRPTSITASTTSVEDDLRFLRARAIPDAPVDVEVIEEETVSDSGDAVES